MLEAFLTKAKTVSVQDQGQGLGFQGRGQDFQNMSSSVPNAKTLPSRTTRLANPSSNPTNDGPIRQPIHGSNTIF